MSKIQHVTHTFDPIYNKESKILILGSMPSPKSREVGFYYENPQNRFWRVMQQLFQMPPLIDKEQKIQFLYQHHIALWDVLASCDIVGADDSSIQNPVVNDISHIIKEASIQAVFTTGSKAGKLYKQYCFSKMKVSSICLPSTSPANCRYYTFERLVEEYKVIQKYL